MNHSQRFISSLAVQEILMLAPPASVSGLGLSQASLALVVAWAVLQPPRQAKRGRRERPVSRLGGCWRLHSGQDAHHLRSLCRWDVLGHVHYGIHGHFWIRLNKAGISWAEWKIKTHQEIEGFVKNNWFWSTGIRTSHLRICLRMWSRRMYLMFSSITDRAPSSSAICFSSHATTSSLFSHR